MDVWSLMEVSRDEVENFLYREARLMDSHDYEGWESLWTDDGVYWVPIDTGDYDPDERISIIYDDRDLIAARIKRLQSDDAYAQRPQSRLSRVVSNIEIDERDGEEIEVQSSFVLIEYRRGIQQVWAGRTTHRLRGSNGDGALRMAFKKVSLIDSDGPLTNCVFIL
jgi:3-phenylpropionate/cinnamic acid dioxygenase small subunit